MPSPIDAFSIAVVEPLSIFAKAQIVQTSRRSNNISLLLSICWALFARIEGSFCRVIQIDELDIPRHPPQFGSLAPVDRNGGHLQSVPQLRHFHFALHACSFGRAGPRRPAPDYAAFPFTDRKSTRLNSSHRCIS